MPTLDPISLLVTGLTGAVTGVAAANGFGAVAPVEAKHHHHHDDDEDDEHHAAPAPPPPPPAPRRLSGHWRPIAFVRPKPKTPWKAIAIAGVAGAAVVGIGVAVVRR